MQRLAKDTAGKSAKQSPSPSKADRQDRARQEAEKARDLLATILDNMNDGVSLFDKDFRLVFGNPKYREAHQYNEQYPVRGASGFDMIRRLIERGEYGSVGDVQAKIDEIAFRMWNTNGQRYVRRRENGRYIEYNFKPLEDGTLLGFYRDITDLKQREAALAEASEIAEHARAEAQRANQAKSSFLAVMSHEIRTPMNGVLGMIEVLDHQGLNDEQRRSLDIMRTSAQSLLSVINGILDFSKIEAGRLELEEAEFSLAALVESAAAVFRVQAASKSLQLSASVHDRRDAMLLGDPTRVRQIIFNLLSNAVKFTETGRIALDASTLRLGNRAVQLTLSVSDTGIGMDDEQRTRLFQPFAQADSSTTRRFGGSGLGLSIVQQLAEMMQGSVSLQSAPGAGSVFTVTVFLKEVLGTGHQAPDMGLPRKPAELKPRAVMRPAGANRVLVIDDHPVNRDVLVRQLGVLGIASDAVASGAEGLAAWRTGTYQAVLCDIQMPGMDGYEFARRLRVLEAANAGQEPKNKATIPRTPLVAITANVMTGEADRCSGAGMDAYIAKPVSLEQLKGVLSRWLPMPEASVEHRALDVSAIDRDVLKAWFGDDHAGIAALLQKFIGTAVESQREIEKTVSSGNLRDAAELAHKLKGAALAVGAKEVACYAGALELDCKAGVRQKCKTVLALLVSELHRARLEIASMSGG